MSAEEGGLRDYAVGGWGGHGASTHTDTHTHIYIYTQTKQIYMYYNIMDDNTMGVSENRGA